MHITQEKNDFYLRFKTMEEKKIKGWQEIAEEKEDLVEEEIEEKMPKGTVREIKRHPLVYISALVFIILLVVGLSAGLILINQKLKKERNIVASLNIELQKKANELDVLKDALSKTEEGKKQLEEAKGKVETQNKQLEQRATTAERTVYSVKEDLRAAEADLSNKKSELDRASRDLSAKQSELDAKQSELSSKQSEIDRINNDLRSKQSEIDKINNDLKNKQSELDKAKRGISLASPLGTLSANMGTKYLSAGTNILKAWEAADAGNHSLAITYLDLSRSDLDRGNEYYKQIQDIVSKIQSGNY